jgi:HEPN domain-containing protein
LLKELTPEFITTRYPDVAGEVPYKLYDEKLAQEFISGAEELMRWIESQMPRQ